MWAGDGWEEEGEFWGEWGLARRLGWEGRVVVG